MTIFFLPLTLVGANQSHGDRIASGAKGVDYIAAFSSRGPTYDGKVLSDTFLILFFIFFEGSHLVIH